MGFKNWQLKPIEVQTMQVNESRIETNKGDDLQERENIMGKNQFLSGVGAKD